MDSYNYICHNIFDKNLKSIPSPGELDISATHFSNSILLQIRLNGEMNCTLEVTTAGLRPIEHDIMHRPIAGMILNREDSGIKNSNSKEKNRKEEGEEEEEKEEEEEELFIRDNLSDYNVHVRLGDSSDPKLPVIASQIAELYQRIIIPNLRRSNGLSDHLSNINLTITLSSKIWSMENRNSKERNNTTNNDGNEDFAKLVFVLKSIKDMYQ